MKNLHLKIFAAFLSACLVLVFCGRDTPPLYWGQYGSVFQADGRFFIVTAYYNSHYPETASITELLPGTNEAKLIDWGLPRDFHYDAGRLWHSEGNALYSHPLEGGDWKLEYKKEGAAKVKLEKISGDKWLLYCDDWERHGGVFNITYLVLDTKTGEETVIHERSSREEINLCGWAGEQILCGVSSGRGGGGYILYRFSPGKRDIVTTDRGAVGAAGRPNWSSSTAALAADGTAYWMDISTGSLRIGWREDGGEKKFADVPLPSYQRFERMYMTEDERLMLTARNDGGLMNLYCFTPKTGRISAIFVDKNLESAGYFIFDQNYYYYIVPDSGTVTQGPLIPLYDLQ